MDDYQQLTDTDPWNTGDDSWHLLPACAASPVSLLQPTLEPGYFNSHHLHYFEALRAQRPLQTTCTRCHGEFSTSEYPRGHPLPLCACGAHRLCPVCFRKAPQDDTRPELFACQSRNGCNQVFSVCRRLHCARRVLNRLCCYHCVPPPTYNQFLTLQYPTQRKAVLPLLFFSSVTRF